MNNKKNIGIWGFGKVGKSVVQILHANDYKLSVMTKAPLSEDEITFAQKHSINLYTEENKEEFFNDNDRLLPSPGVDIRSCYQTHKDKWTTELDLFYSHFKKPIIAITGTVGKTTITSMLDHILKQYGIQICTGGNIGTPMCNLITQQDNVEYAVLEVSSFQLEYCSQFAPHIAIWTNFAPNHLDRHTLDNYFDAKYKIVAHQTGTQKALVPLSLATKIRSNTLTQKSLCFFSPSIPTQPEQKILHHDDVIFFIEHNYIKKKIRGQTTSLIALELLPDITFIENWLIICSTLDILGLDFQKLPEHAHTLMIPAHRMEKIVANNIIFYNDSKSTTTTSTYAAIEKLDGKSIILFIGGLSKGVDRRNFIKELKDRVKLVYCFGAEAETLNTYCTTYDIAAQSFSTLDNAFAACIKNATTNDCILFSPAGSSYDLFKNYEERGDYFKQLVRNFNNLHTTT